MLVDLNGHLLELCPAVFSSFTINPIALIFVSNYYNIVVKKIMCCFRFVAK